jgi:hypothetical protein
MTKFGNRGRVELGLTSNIKSHKKVLDARKELRTSTGPEIQAKARKYAPDAVDALGEIVKSKIATDVARISAAQTLLDRAYGRPTQTNVNATVNTDGKPPEITDKELDTRIKETLTRIEGLTKRKREKIQGEDRPTDLRKFN